MMYESFCLMYKMPKGIEIKIKGAQIKNFGIISDSSILLTSHQQPHWLYLQIYLESEHSLSQVILLKSYHSFSVVAYRFTGGRSISPSGDLHGLL